MQISLILFWFFVGGSVGSLTYALSFRLPQSRPWANARSICEFCQRQLRWFELIPFFSFIFQRGRCRYCHKLIGFGYLLAELIMGLFFVVLIQARGLDGGTILGLFLGSTLFLIALIDYRYQIIPDRLLLLVLVVWGGFLGLIYWRFPLQIDLPWANFATGLGLFIFFGLPWWISKGRWIGFGDAKLGGLLGLVFGFPQAIWLVYLAIIGALGFSAGLLLRGRATRKTAIPFGSFLAGSGLILIIWGPVINSFFMRLLL